MPHEKPVNLDISESLVRWIRAADGNSSTRPSRPVNNAVMKVSLTASVRRSEW